MRKKNGVTLYDGGLILLLVVVIIGFVVSVAKRQEQIKKEYGERLAKERIFVSTYSDNELIAKYYQIEAELQNALDELGTARGQAMREEIGKINENYTGGGAVGGFAQGFSKSFNVGAINERLIKIKIKILRQIGALYLTEIAKRELKLPK